MGTPLGEIPLPAEHGLPRCSLQTPTTHLERDGHSSFAPGAPPLCLSSRHPHPPVHLSVLQLLPASLPRRSRRVLSPFRALALARSLPLYEGVAWVFFQTLQEEVVYKHSLWQLCDLIDPKKCEVEQKKQEHSEIFETKRCLQAEFSLGLPKGFPAWRKLLAFDSCP